VPYCFVAGRHEDAIVIVIEAEGPSSIVPATGRTGLFLRRITLDVSTDLELVGLTAKVASALAAESIPANVVAGLHHDHIFVPERLADRALAVLQNLASGSGL
jgi:hypothetical protein